MDLTPAQLEVVSSLAQDDIPFKLRCATCNKLALNAFRLPCCEQSICESCQQTLPENCPVCDHSPLSSDLCKPNKALRTTIRVFLRTEEKKREKVLPPAQQTLVKDEGATVGTPTGQSDGNEQIKTEDVHVTGAGNSVEVDNAVSEEASKPEGIVDGETGMSGPSEDLNNAQQPEMIATQEKEASQPRESSTTEQTEVNTQKVEGNAGVNGGPGQAQAAQNGMGLDFTNGFTGMGWNSQPDYTNQMMQMMASGGMGANPIANFQNMMGMPGFGMDPMSQSMYGGFGNMGMNMNNGMNGMNGMNFNAGQGMYGAWNGQQNMWNGGQVNNNPSAFSNSMGNFGQNSGYGYNMSQPSGNFSQMPHQQQFPNHDYQQGYNRPYGRGRGRGRGYDGYGNRGRGGYGQQQQQQYNQGYQGNHQAQQNQPQQQWQQQNGARQHSTPNRSTSPAETVIITDTVLPPSRRTTQTEEEDQALESIEDQPQQDEDRSPQGEDQQSVKNEADQPVSSPVKDAPAPEHVKEETTDEKPDVTNEKNHIQPVRSVLDDDITQNETPPLHTESMPYTEDPVQSGTSVMAPPTAPAGPAALFIGDTWDTHVRGRGSARTPYRGAVRGRGSFSNGSAFTSPPRTLVSDFPISAIVEPKGLGVAGAPTGPKAMREGYTGASRGVNVRGSAAVSSIPTGPKIPEQDRSESQDRYRDRDESRSRSRSRSRSPSRHHSRRHRHRRHRSGSVSDTELEREKRRGRKHRRSRRDDDPEQDVQEEYHQASRASTPESSRIPSRDEPEKDRRSSHKHRSSHRSHRRRSRSRERRGDKTPLTPLENGAEKNGDYVKEERQAERSSRHTEKERSKRHREEDYEDKSNDRKRSRRDRSPTPEDSEYSSHRESRRQKREAEPEIPKGPRQKTFKQKTYEKLAEPQKDPHTLEREARNRERLLKEQQRRDALSTGRDNKGPKRRESKQSDGGSRRMSYKYEDDDGHAARATRIEEEREAARWN